MAAEQSRPTSRNNGKPSSHITDVTDSIVSTLTLCSQLALKTVDLRKIPEDYRERAKDEAKILHVLNHQHLVHHVNSYIKHPFLCIITEFCAGGDMDKLVAHLGFRSGLPEKLIVCWLMQTASALNVSVVD